MYGQRHQVFDAATEKKHSSAFIWAERTAKVLIIVGTLGIAGASFAVTPGTTAQTSSAPSTIVYVSALLLIGAVGVVVLLQSRSIGKVNIASKIDHVPETFTPQAPQK